MRFVLAGLLIVIGCSSTTPAPAPSPAPGPATAAPKPATTAPGPDTPRAGERECMPVVAPRCGCVYGCGTGVRQANGSYAVHHSFWNNTTLKAHIADWCQNGECTPAFHAELICDIVCPPKPADMSCHFEGDRCVTGKAKP